MYSFGGLYPLSHLQTQVSKLLIAVFEAGRREATVRKAVARILFSLKVDACRIGMIVCQSDGDSGGRLRKIALLLFLIFYLASIYAVAQERTTLIVSGLEHSCSRDASGQMDLGCKELHDHFPNYREAKPRSIGRSGLGEDQFVLALPYVSDLSFHVQNGSLKALNIWGSSISRAPPSYR